VENVQYPYQVKEHHRVNGDRYYTVDFHGKLIIILRNKKIADEYIELNKNHNGTRSSTSN
jgi:hypothetical protein